MLRVPASHFDPSNREVLKKYFNFTTSDNETLNPRELYIALTDFMQHVHFYSKQHLRDWIFARRLQEDTEKNARMALEIKSLEAKYNDLLAQNRKVAKEEPTQESLTAERQLERVRFSLHLQIQERENDLTIANRWLYQLAKNMTTRHYVNEVLTLTDFTIIERWVVGGRSRAEIDQFCCECITEMTQLFHVQKNSLGKHSFKFKVNTFIPPELKLTCCLSYILNDTIHLLKTIEKVNFILDAFEPPYSLHDDEFSPPRKSDRAASTKKLPTLELRPLSESEIPLNLCVQLPEVLSAVQGLTDKSKYLLELLIEINTQQYINLDRNNRLFLQDTMEKIKKFQLWGIAATDVMRRIFGELDPSLLEHLDLSLHNAAAAEVAAEVDAELQQRPASPEVPNALQSSQATRQFLAQRGLARNGQSVIVSAARSGQFPREKSLPDDMALTEPATGSAVKASSSSSGLSFTIFSGRKEKLEKNKKKKEKKEKKEKRDKKEKQETAIQITPQKS